MYIPVIQRVAYIVLYYPIQRYKFESNSQFSNRVVFCGVSCINNAVSSLCLWFHMTIWP